MIILILIKSGQRQKSTPYSLLKTLVWSLAKGGWSGLEVPPTGQRQENFNFAFSLLTF